MIQSVHNLPKRFKKTIVRDLAGQALQNLAQDYRIMLLSVLEEILRRYERDPGYKFFDTKINLQSGTDFPDDDPLRGKRTIYSWIQGRALEALAAHDIWISQSAHIAEPLKQHLSVRIRKALKEVIENMEVIRLANQGRLFFMMSQDGTPLKLADDGQFVRIALQGDDPYNFSDLFYAKGLAAAAHLLGDSERFDTACKFFRDVCSGISQGKFVSDQQSLDPKNPVGPVTGRLSHGPRMIAIGGLANFLEHTADLRYKDRGIEFIEYILANHLNSSDAPSFGQPYDMWEFVDEEGDPYYEGRLLRSDPGHACEFVGLAAKFIKICEAKVELTQPEQLRIEKIKKILPLVLERNFRNGFSAGGYGIVKSFDLIGRKPINSDMPWWSLPETMRAAAEVCPCAGQSMNSELAKIITHCSNAFIKYYVKPELNLMAIQTLGMDGQVVDSIPATPDADPGYHTGLSIIDFLKEIFLGNDCA